MDEENRQLSRRLINESAYEPSPTDIVYVISYAVNRYCLENDIEDIFRWNPEIDNIGHSLGYIDTLRVRGENQTLYIDYDGNKNRIHVYPVED